MHVRRIVLSLAAAAALAFPAAAANITSKSLTIQGAALQIAETSKAVTTGIDIPVTVQTVFGGKTNDEAVSLEGVSVLGELTGPGLENPIQLSTAPGHKFQIPGLAQLGTYYLQNVRMMKGTEFLQYATPSIAVITVSDLLETKVTVKQLSPKDLRDRGITIDSRNFDVYEYTFTFIVNGQTVTIPFPVVIDPRTHQALPVARESEYVLPSPKLVTPPRWTPPMIIPTEFAEEGELPEPGEEPKDKEKGGTRPSIPAAIVIPNSLAVLHHFFAVGLMVTNGSPSGSTARLEDINATIRIPTALRTVKTSPSVAFGQAVPIVEPTTGVTFLIAQSRGEAEWTLEGLQAGTHRIDFDLRATLKQQGQDDIPLKAAPSASVVIHDPRFNITFSHPDTVRKGIEYSTFAFITNMSPDAQTITVTSEVQPCDQAPPDANTCRLNGGQSDLMTIPAGDMRVIEYKLRPGVTGGVFATAGTISDSGTLSASVKLTMGVSLTGIPLSPATLIMPYYAQFVDPDVVSANLMLFGLGYSLATAPLNAMTAKFPRVIKTDVFQRAVDVSRAGQRIFITNASATEKRDAYTHLVLDLLGNGGTELREWDALRRRDGEKSGRLAGASVVRQLEATGLTNNTSITAFANTFASTTAHRQGYLAVFAHGAAGGERPYAISLTGKTTTAVTDIPNEAASGWKRGLPFSDISKFSGSSENGELALIGRWTEDIDVTVMPAQDGNVAIDLIYPQSATADGHLLRAHFDITNAKKNEPITISVTRGAQTLNATSNNVFITNATATAVDPLPLRISGARQDLHQDEEGHKVSLLYSRPVKVQDNVVLATKYTGTIDFNKDDVQYSAPRPISASALQSDDRTVNITFDHALHQNGTYLIASGALVDPVTSVETPFPDQVAPKIDNDLPAGIVFGHVVKGDGSAIGKAEVILRQYKPGDNRDPSAPPQYDLTRLSDGAFLFEFVRRQTDAGYSGAYRIEATAPDGKHTTMEASVRLPGKVHKITIQFLGRGAAEGYVRYNDGSIAADAKVVIGSTMFDQFRSATADNAGYYRIDDLPVGPLTFSATDEAGNVTFASNEIATPGQLVTQNLSIYRKPFPGTGRVYGIVRRSDTNKVVAGAHVGVYSQGYGLVDGFTDAEGRFDFPKVPSGFVTLLASEWSVSRTAIALDFDLKADEVKQADLLLSVPSTEKYASLTGTVWRENPLQPGQYERVAGALVKISNYRIVTADAQGVFTYDEIPTTFAGRGITAYDPATQRVKTSDVPTLNELPAANSMSIFINATDRGSGTIRVRLLNAAGNPVPGYRVIVPGFPPDVLPEVSAGVYELKNVPVGVKYNIWAVPKGTRPPSGTDPRPYGDQLTSGSSKVEFNGHVAALALRLPGQGTVRVKVRSQFDLITPVNLTYGVWSEQEQGTESLTLTQSTDKNGEADYAVFTSIPALSGYNAASAHPQYGYAAVGAQLAYDGALNNHTLQLNTLATVRGTVYAIDGVTPIAGATVTIYNGRSDPGPKITGPDGRFEFQDQPSSTAVTVTAQVTQSGIYRAGFSVAYTPPNGGSVDNMAVVLRKRGFVDGRVVYRDYKTYDPNNPANNVPDNTPNDLSDNAPVPLAKFYLRELDFPYRSFGQNVAPLTADVTGRFVINNVFVGALRATAWDSGNEELRGDWQGSIDEEGADAAPKAYIAVSGGGGGVGGAKISVVDPNQSYKEVANAEVSLYRGGGRAFDFGSTDATGFVEFSQLPVGSYSVSAYSKALGKTSRTKTINVTANGIAAERLELEFSGVVDGTFTDPMANNKPIPGAIVRLTASNYSTNSSTDVNGFFIFNGVREGAFSLDVKDTESNRRAHRDNSLTVLDPHRTVNLELEPTETLHLAVYLPNDTGGNSGILAPPVTAEVTQRCWFSFGVRNCDYLRELQGNPLVFTSALKNAGYGIAITEIGGQQRTAGLGGSFPYGTQSNPATYVWPAYGDVNVTVTQAGAAAAGAKVTVSGGNKSVTVYTDAAGLATARGLPLNTGIYIQATSVDGKFNGADSTTIQRTSQPASASVALGNFAGVTGRVFSEADGSPSVGTLVFAYFNSSTAQMRTDGEGRYTILGIPTAGTSGTAVNLTFIGPDDNTVGGYRSKTVFATSGVAAVDDIRLDATAPQLESIVPADGSMNVSPDTSIAITFSEPLNTSTIHNNTFQLLDADGVATGKNITWQTIAGNKFVVTLTIPKPATGFPLRSNTLYRVIVTNGVTDVTGHSLPVTRGFSFTTSDYAEPRVQKVLPASPVPRETTFQFTFNEPIDPAPWSTGGNGVFHIYKLAAPGGASAAIVRELGARAFIDPATLMSLFIAPADNDPIEPESFYRVVFAGVRDPQGNVLGEQTYHFFSFDEVDPYVVFTNPPASEQLVSGSEYELRIELHNGSATGSVATDVAKVDYFTVAANGTETPFAAVTKAPFSAKILGPEAPAGGATLTVGAQATDTSGRRGPKATAQWTVKPNAAPANVAVTPLQASAYPSNKVSASVTFEDEGSFASVVMTFTVPLTTGSTSVPVTKTQSYTRNANGTWPVATFTFDLPVTAQPGTNATFSTVVNDVRGLSSAPVTATTAVAEDLIQPQIINVLPPPNTTYFKDQTFTVDATVKDNETTVQTVTFFVDGNPVALASSSTDPATGRQTFRSASIKVPPVADDTSIPIVVTAKDYNNNAKSTTFNVTYKGVNDPDAPKVTWLCPIDKAAIPADYDNFALKLRISAVDQDVTSVTFTTNTPTPVTATGARDTSTSYDWTGTLNFARTPAPGTVVITVTVKDTITTHQVDLPITLDVVRTDIVLSGAQAISDLNINTYQGKSVALVGSAAVLAPQLPVTFENLLVLNGARVETLATTTTKEYKVDFTVKGITYVDCDSSVNVSERGYVGGWRSTTDGTNSDSHGRTAGNTTNGGADSNSQGSYAGLGGDAGIDTGTNAPYGSITKPTDLGSGGGGSANCCNLGGSGGGAIALHGGTGENELSRIVIAGVVVANGAHGFGAGVTWGAGSGGSIWMEGKQALFGPRAYVGANGG
ncbi:MAG TPA: Ig-like domain-containing protein, partial [Thermoanaerobaculia bacterium]|nr:Ig-like domain-containing protein [Thermoanaerobaculia bacterium]